MNKVEQEISVREMTLIEFRHYIPDSFESFISNASLISGETN